MNVFSVILSVITVKEELIIVYCVRLIVVEICRVLNVLVKVDIMKILLYLLVVGVGLFIFL